MCDLSSPVSLFTNASTFYKQSSNFYHLNLVQIDLDSTSWTWDIKSINISSPSVVSKTIPLGAGNGTSYNQTYTAGFRLHGMTLEK